MLHYSYTVWIQHSPNHKEKWGDLFKITTKRMLFLNLYLTLLHTTFFSKPVLLNVFSAVWKMLPCVLKWERCSYHVKSICQPHFAFLTGTYSVSTIKSLLLHIIWSCLVKYTVENLIHFKWQQNANSLSINVLLYQQNAFFPYFWSSKCYSQPPKGSPILTSPLFLYYKSLVFLQKRELNLWHCSIFQNVLIFHAFYWNSTVIWMPEGIDHEISF